MLSRLGTALHWLSVVWTASVCVGVFVLIALERDTDAVIGAVLIIGIFALPVMTLGWISNFIFNNHEHPLPWGKESSI